MKTIKTILSVFIFCALIITDLVAQTEAKDSEPIEKSSLFKHSINMCPGGIIFGVYSMNYEYMVSKSQGIVGRIDYEAVPKAYTDALIESSGIGFTLNYRWHISGQMGSVFLGVYSRYKIFTGDGILESTEFDFTLTDLTFGLNIGKRWVWNSGFNLNFALGYGISHDSLDADPTNTAIEATLDDFKNEYDFLSPFLGELSIGYAF